MKKIQQYYPELLSGYVDVGIEKDSENYEKAIEILKNENLPTNILSPHPFNDDFLRINVTNKNQIDSLTLHHQINNNGNILQIPVPLSDGQKEALNSIYQLYKQDGSIRNVNIQKFMEEWDLRPNLKTLKEWWDNIDTSFQITSVGKVLAHSNAQRCDKTLPPLN